MAYRLDCERVLATVDWADSVLVETGLKSGYAVDAFLRGLKRSSVRRGTTEEASPPPPGKFARYQRGDCAPSHRVLEQLDTATGLAVGRFQHPLYTVLQVGWEGRDSWQSRDLLEAALGDTERWLGLRLSRFVDLGWTFERRPMTARLMQSLAMMGTGHALTALLWGAMERADHGEDPRPAIERAMQCMVLAFARGEFPLTWPLVAARVRQRVLDAIVVEGHVADTAALDLGTAVRSAQALFAVTPGARLEPAAQRRRRLQEWLSSAPQAAALKPRFVVPEEAAQSRRAHPVAVQMLPVPRGQFAHVRDFGRRAREVLTSALGDYVVLGETPTP